jgi:LPXTG-motif cell wall-anchored protein
MANVQECVAECERMFPEHGFTYDSCRNYCGAEPLPRGLGASILPAGSNLPLVILALLLLGAGVWMVWKRRKGV